MNSIIVRTFMFVGCGSLVCQTTMTGICPLSFWGRAWSHWGNHYRHPAVYWASGTSDMTC